MTRRPPVPAPPDPDREDALARGRARMDEARHAAGDLTCHLTVAVIDDVRNVPVTWTATWRPR